MTSLLGNSRHVGDCVRLRTDAFDGTAPAGRVGVIADDATGDEQWPYDYRVADRIGGDWRWSAWIRAHEIVSEPS